MIGSMAAKTRPAALAALILTAAISATGCGSGDDDARAEVASARSDRSAQRVDRQSDQVSVSRVTRLSDRKTTAIVVELQSRSSKLLTDLPVTVGVRSAGREIPYNAADDLAWFRTHVPVLSPGASTIWVFQAPTDRRVPSGDAFARVGDPDPRVPDQGSPVAPVLQTSWAPAGGVPREPRFFVGNRSGVPQTDVPVYAFARRGDRYVAAGVGTIPQLDEDAETLAIRLAGNPGKGPFQAIAAPTVLR